MGENITCCKRYELVESGLTSYVPFAQQMVLTLSRVNYNEEGVLRGRDGVVVHSLTSWVKPEVEGSIPAPLTYWTTS
jgi:hypothetical protein